MKTYFLNLFKFNHWANEKLIDSISGQNIGDEKILRLLSHLLLAEKIWMMRIKRQAYENKSFWTVLTLPECRRLSVDNSAVYKNYIETLPDNNFSAPVTYENSKGITYTNSVNDILTHVCFHSTYHRGQIALELRRINKEPVLTDYIAYVRE